MMLFLARMAVILPFLDQICVERYFVSRLFGSVFLVGKWKVGGGARSLKYRTDQKVYNNLRKYRQGNAIKCMSFLKRDLHTMAIK